MGGIFAGWNFRGWNFRGWNFRGWNFPGTPTPSTWYRIILPIEKPTLFDGQMHKTSCMYTFALLDEFCSKAGKIREVKCLSDLKSSLFMYYIVVFDIDVKINDNERVLSILWH